MELRHIRYFIVLAEELNFSRAAQRLHIAQPPLSRQIKELENEIGAKLFNRSKRHVELTPAGKVFLQKAYQILDQVEQARFNARLTAIGKEGELRISFTGAVQDLIPVIRKYRKIHPQVGIILKHMNNKEQLKALNEKTIDIALISTPIESGNINVSPLKTLKFYVAFPENHPLLKKEKLYLQDLANETFIMTPRSVGVLYYETFMSAFNKAHFTPNIAIQADDLHTVLALVADGIGITLTPSPAEKVKGIVRRDLEDVNLSLVGSIAWRKDNKSKILEDFLLFVNSLYDNEETDLRLLN